VLQRCGAAVQKYKTKKSLKKLQVTSYRLQVLSLTPYDLRLTSCDRKKGWKMKGEAGGADYNYSIPRVRLSICFTFCRSSGFGENCSTENENTFNGWGCSVIGSTVVSATGRGSIPLSSTNQPEHSAERIALLEFIGLLGFVGLLSC